MVFTRVVRVTTLFLCDVFVSKYFNESRRTKNKQDEQINCTFVFPFKLELIFPKFVKYLIWRRLYLPGNFLFFNEAWVSLNWMTLPFVQSYLGTSDDLFTYWGTVPSTSNQFLKSQKRFFFKLEQVTNS